MVQMIGRGLRTVNPEEFPGVVKTDCIVMDFGTSVLTHGSLDETVNLDDRQKNGQGEAQTKECPDCGAELALNTRECPFCQHVFGSTEKDELSQFTMTEYDLMQMSPFRWIDLFGDKSLMMALGFDGFVGVANTSSVSVAFGKKNGAGARVRILAVGGGVQATAAADDFLREIEDSGSAKKTKRWLDQRMSKKQRTLLSQRGIHVNFMDFSWTKYKASCMLSFLWNKDAIESFVERYL
jgi:hypothetical protein